MGAGLAAVLPATDWRLHQLRDAKGKSAHEVIPGGPVPVPHLHHQPAVLICGLQLAAEHQDDTQFIRFSVHGNR